MRAGVTHPRLTIGHRQPFVISWILLALLAERPVAKLVNGLWRTDDHAYSPMLVIIGLVMIADTTYRRAAIGRGSVIGLMPVVLGLVMMILGNLLANIFLEFAGIVPIFAGLLTYLGGFVMLRAYAMPILIWCFAIPLPGAVVTALTMPLKMQISALASDLLFVCGLPVAHEGVVIDIGDYRLLVAEACAGLQSMFSLLSIAIIYAYVMRYRLVCRGLLLLVAAVPIVIVVNFLRVLILALVTYWFGTGVSEGPLHETTGLVMFAAAFFMLMMADDLFGLSWLRRRGT